MFSAFYAFRYLLKSIHTITYAQPRVCNVVFKVWMELLHNLNLWRVVNQQDIVPRIPSFLDGFNHAGHLMWRLRTEQENLSSVSTLQEGEIQEIEGMESNVLAYYRQIGSKRLNYRGVNDFSLALLGPISENELGALVDHHSLSNMIETWLSDPTMYASDFEQ